MKTKEILTIIGLIFLGLCFLCGLAKMGMKDAKRKGNCDKACGAFVFLGVALIAVSSVLKSSGPSGPSGPSAPAPGEGQVCIPPSRYPGSGLRGNCQPGLECKRGAADLMPVCRKPGPSGPAPAPAPAPGEGQVCIPPSRYPGSGLRGNCQPGLVCKRGDVGVMPVCMKPGPSGPAPAPGEGQVYPTEPNPGSGLRGNCQPGLVCKRGDVGVMPVCMKK